MHTARRSLLLQQQLRPHHRLLPAGIWPEFSLLNHSCAPNTVAVLVGDRILVRACSKGGGL